MGNSPNPNEAGLLTGSLTAAWAGMRTRYVELLLATLLIVATMVPTQGVQWLGTGAAERVQQRQQAAQQRSAAAAEAARSDGASATAPAPAQSAMSAEDASALMADLFVWLGASCGALILTVLLVYPTITSATLVGAAVAAGRSTKGQFFRGFTRYGATLLTWLLMLAGCIAAALPMGCFAAILAPLLAMTSKGPSASANAIVICVLCVLILPILWLAVRFGWAVIRVADGARPNLGPIASYRASWRATAGNVQWRVLGTLLVMGLIAVVAMAPGMALLLVGLQTEGSPLTSVGVALAAITGIFGMYPWSLAVYGAIYEAIMTSHDGAPPGAQVGLD